MPECRPAELVQQDAVYFNYPIAGKVAVQWKDYEPHRKENFSSEYLYDRCSYDIVTGLDADPVQLHP